jgi:predicted N-acetyltransferase YhbS
MWNSKWGSAITGMTIIIAGNKTMTIIRHELSSDFAAREALLTRAFGVARFRKTSERLRDGRLPAAGLAFTALGDKGKVIGTVRLWHVIAGSAGPSLLLGPLAVDGKAQGKGLGSALMNHAINTATVLGYESILLVGDAPYYGKFGFSVEHTRSLHLSGPVDRTRFLGLELVPEALDGAEGLVSASGEMALRGRVAA